MASFKKNVSVILTLITIILIGVITNFILSKIVPVAAPAKIDNNQIKQVVQNEVAQSQNKPSLYPDYDLLKDFNYIQIATDTPSYVLNGNQIKGRIDKNLYPKGSFDRMYVFIEAYVDNGKPLSVYDDIWATFNFKGGHIYPTESLPTPPSNISDLLYSAQNLPYRVNVNSVQNSSLDVLKIFNQEQPLGVNVFLSTARPGGMVKEFRIYYECSSNSDCSISYNKPH